MKLYGTTTSPFVRRVRVVAAEVGEEIELVNTAPDAGQALLREITPIRKVPIATVAGRTLFDSRVIIDWLTTTRGFGGITPPRDRWREHNLVNAIDSALDAVIQLFYLRRDGIAIYGTPYATRQLERTDAIFAWLATQLAADVSVLEKTRTGWVLTMEGARLLPRLLALETAATAVADEAKLVAPGNRLGAAHHC